MPIPEWVFWAAFLFTLTLAVFLTFHEARVKADSKAVRVPLLQLRDYCVKKGWRIGTDESLEILDFLDAVKQSVVFGEARLWGRLDRFGDGSMGLTRDEPLTLISEDHFRDYDIDVLSFLQASENQEVVTYSVSAVGRSATESGYRDLTIEIYSLKAWEKEARKSFKGRRDADERSQVARLDADGWRGGSTAIYAYEDNYGINTPLNGRVYG